MKIYDLLQQKRQKSAQYFCLLDPDKLGAKQAAETAATFEENGADGLLVGGSIMLHNSFQENLKQIKQAVSIPVLIFPGLFNFVSPWADAILLLSVISSRNPQMLIGEQVRAAPLIKHYNLESIGTGYMIIDGGNSTSVSYMSGSNPMPRTKDDIAVAHALAAEYLGMRCLYMDAGSGAQQPITDSMISAVRANISLPMIVGGGIRTPEVAMQKAAAGADFIVTGDILEKNPDPSLVKDFAEAIHSVTRS